MADAKKTVKAKTKKTPAKAEQKKPGRKGDGGIYLVFANDSGEFPIALKSAIELAKSHRGYVGLIYAMDVQEFQNWADVEEKIRKELREKAEKFIWAAAKKVDEQEGMKPGVYIGEGDAHSVILEAIENEPQAKMLVLAGASDGGPSSLVSYFTGKGLHKMSIPVLIVPGRQVEKAGVEDEQA